MQIIVGHLRCPFGCSAFSAPRLRLVAELKLYCRFTALLVLLAALVFSLLVKLHCCCIALRVVMIGLNLPRDRMMGT